MSQSTDGLAGVSGTGSGRAAELLRVQGVLQDLERGIDRLARSLAVLKAFRPLTAARIQGMDAGGEAELDAFVLRFIQMQDGLSRQGFRAVLLLDEDEAPPAMGDVVAAMERRGVIADATSWTLTRITRTRLMPDHPEHPDRAAAALEEALEAAPRLLDMARCTVAYLRCRLPS